MKVFSDRYFQICINIRKKISSDYFQFVSTFVVFWALVSHLYFDWVLEPSQSAEYGMCTSERFLFETCTPVTFYAWSTQAAYMSVSLVKH